MLALLLISVVTPLPRHRTISLPRVLCFARFYPSPHFHVWVSTCAHSHTLQNPTLHLHSHLPSSQYTWPLFPALFARVRYFCSLRFSIFLYFSFFFSFFSPFSNFASTCLLLTSPTDHCFCNQRKLNYGHYVSRVKILLFSLQVNEGLVLAGHRITFRCLLRLQGGTKKGRKWSEEKLGDQKSQLLY